MSNCLNSLKIDSTVVNICNCRYVICSYNVAYRFHNPADGLGYTSVASTTLTYLPNEVEKEVSFSILDNKVLETMENFIVSLTSTGELGVGTMFPSVTTVLIADNDGECV